MRKYEITTINKCTFQTEYTITQTKILRVPAKDVSTVPYWQIKWQNWKMWKPMKNSLVLEDEQVYDHR